MAMTLKGINGARAQDADGNYTVPSMARCAAQIEQRHEGAAIFAANTMTAPKAQNSSRFTM